MSATPCENWPGEIGQTACLKFRKDAAAAGHTWTHVLPAADVPHRTDYGFEEGGGPGSHEYPGTMGCETVCEGHDELNTEASCAAVLGCEWDEGKCWSKVGGEDCPTADEAEKVNDASSFEGEFSGGPAGPRVPRALMVQRSPRFPPPRFPRPSPR